MTAQLHCHSLCSLTTLFPLKATSSDRIVTSSLLRLDPWITVLCGNIMWGYLCTDWLRSLVTALDLCKVVESARNI